MPSELNTMADDAPVPCVVLGIHNSMSASFIGYVTNTI